MKRSIAILLLLAMILGVFAGCGFGDFTAVTVLV